MGWKIWAGGDADSEQFFGYTLVSGATGIGGGTMRVRYQQGYLRLGRRKNGPDCWETATSLALGKGERSMASIGILHEVQQLYSVSDRLDVLAEQNPLVAEALITISGSVRNNTTLLEVLIAMKVGPIPGLDSADA